MRIATAVNPLWTSASTEHLWSSSVTLGRPMADVDKALLIEAAVARLRDEAQALRESARQTREGAIHEESRAENDKDTRGLEASYLARGQAARVEETEDAVTRLSYLELRSFGSDDPVALSALVSVDVDGAERHYFLVPAAGGQRVQAGGVEVQLLTPSSPVGRALIGKRAGDSFELTLAGRVRQYEVVQVR